MMIPAVRVSIAANAESRGVVSRADSKYIANVPTTFDVSVSIGNDQQPRNRYRSASHNHGRHSGSFATSTVMTGRPVYTARPHASESAAILKPSTHSA